MKWAYTIRRKISAALLLGAIFSLLFVKNMMDSKNVSQLGTSFSSVYEDRLVVESYIYRMSEHLFRKKFLLDTCSSAESASRIKPDIDHYNKSILDIIADYEETKLTEEETSYFENFKDNVTRLIAYEQAYFRNLSAGGDASAKKMIDTHFNEASANLDDLSSIQLSEGKILNERSQKIVAGSSILTHFEVGILIAIGLMIVALIFESTTTAFTRGHKQSLN